MLNGRNVNVNEAIHMRNEGQKKHRIYPAFSCCECENPVIPHKEGVGQAAHFEHRKRNLKCSLSDPPRGQQ